MNDNPHTLPLILYRDDFLIAIDKPRGLSVHRSPLDKHAEGYALQLAREAAGQQVFPLHRLDKATSGVLLFALTQATAAKMAALFRQRQVRKRYLAIVRGFIPEKGGVDHPLKALEDKKGGMRTDKIAHPAVTVYSRLATVEINRPVDKYPTSRYSLVELVPETGRRHQLRRHMAHISHPIIGDTIYGKGKHNLFFRETFACHGLMLCAVELGFVHPETTDPLVITAQPDEMFRALLSRLDWSLGPGRSL